MARAVGVRVGPQPSKHSLVERRKAVAKHAVHEAEDAVQVRVGDADGVGHPQRVERKQGPEAVVVEGQGVVEGVEDVQHGCPRESRDARLVLAKPPLHVGAQGAGGGEAREEHQHGERGVALVPVIVGRMTQSKTGEPRRPCPD